MQSADGEVKAVGLGRGPWRPEQNAIELRRPQEVPATAAPADSSSADEVSDGLSKVTISTLSVNAKEFVPKGFTCTTALPDTTQTDHFEENEQDENFGDCEMTQDEWIIHHLTEELQSLTDNPGQFEQFSSALLEELAPMLSVEESVNVIVMVIINQAISEYNFRYSGARLCNLLSNSKSGSTFRRVLLTRLSEEHEKIEDNMENDCNRVYGFVHFLGELYIQLQLSNGLRVAVLGDAIVQALKILIQIPVLENIKHTCSVLKLAGRLLDEDHPDIMDGFFPDFQKLITDERAGVRVKDMVNAVLKLRSEKWGFSASCENPSTPSSSICESPASLWNNDGVYYGPDHQALTAEEYKFLKDNCGGEEVASSSGEDSTVWDPTVNDSENAEIMAAFKEFINQKP